MSNKIFLLAICLFSAFAAQAQTAKDVLETATRANNYFIKIWPDPTVPTFFKRERPSSLWTRGVYYEGLMALQAVDPQQRYIDYTDRWANHHQWTPRNGTKTVHADDQCCMQTYLERYMQTKDERMLAMSKENMEKQMAAGKVDHWTWIDAIQMAMPAYSHMYVITKDKRYMDYAMKCYLWTRNTCGDKGMLNRKEGLWWRDADFDPPYKEAADGKNCYWSRGNGWVYAALARVMSDLKALGINSKTDKQYKVLYDDFMLMSKALLKCQRTDGFWNVSLLSPKTYGGPETSGTALFLYGMAWGIQQGLLPAASYRPACDRAWRALASAVHEDGFIGYVQGTGKEPKDGQPVTYDKIPDFEDYGTGCFLLGATEYAKLIK